MHKEDGIAKISAEILEELIPPKTKAEKSYQIGSKRRSFFRNFQFEEAFKSTLSSFNIPGLFS